jgi:hypothetical protein
LIPQAPFAEIFSAEVCVMDWKKERDLLIAQTMAFVQSVTGKQPDAEQMSAKPGIGATPVPQATPVTAVEMLAAEIVAPPQNSTQASIRISRSMVSSDIRSEIQARVANFRAHQERFNREREEYCSATLIKLRAALNDPGSGPAKGTPYNR